MEMKTWGIDLCTQWGKERVGQLQRSLYPMDPLLSSVTGKLLDYKGRTLWRFYKKLGINIPYDPTNSLLVIYPE